MRERFKKLIAMSNNLSEVLTYNITDHTREELQKMLILTDSEIAEIANETPVLKDG